MKTSAVQPIIQTATLYSSPPLGRRLGHALNDTEQNTCKHSGKRPEGVDAIQKTLVIINLCITNISLVLAITCAAKALLLSTATLAALASIMGIFVMSYSKNTQSTAEIYVMTMCNMYVTFFTIIAASVSLMAVITS